MTAPATAPRPDSAARRWSTLAACIVVIAAVTLWYRYRAIGISTLWLDDAWVGVGAHFPSIGDTVGAGLTSPGFSLLYRAWATVFGPGATTAQLLALGFAAAAPIVLFCAASERGLPWYAALLGGGLLATAPAHIDMSTRFKQYSAEAFATTLVLWAAWRVLDRTASRERWVVFTTVAIGASLLSSIGAVTAGTALGVCIVATLVSRPLRLRAPVIASCAYGVVVVPWLLLAVRPNIHPKLTDYWRGTYLDGDGFAGGLGTRLKVVATAFQGVDSTLVLAGLAIAAGVVVFRRPLLGLLLLAPTLVAIGLAALTISPLGTGRTDVYLLPSYALLVAVAVAEVAAMVPARVRWATGALAVAGFALVAIVASPAPSPADTFPCPDPPIKNTTLMRCPYPLEDLTPLVHLAEGRRRPGDEIVVYSSAGYAYGIATRYPIEKRPDPRAPTDWVVKVNGPNIAVLEAHRADPEKWAGPLDRIAARSPRIWLIGSHLFPDWWALKDMLILRGYSPAQVHTRAGAELVLFVKR